MASTFQMSGNNTKKKRERPPTANRHDGNYAIPHPDTKNAGFNGATHYASTHNDANGKNGACGTANAISCRGA